MSNGSDSRSRAVLWYRVKAAMLRREAHKPCNFRARTVLLYSASRYEWLADHADEEIGLLDLEPHDSETPTVH